MGVNIVKTILHLLDQTGITLKALSYEVLRLLFPHFYC